MWSHNTCIITDSEGEETANAAEETSGEIMDKTLLKQTAINHCSKILRESQANTEKPIKKKQKDIA